MRGRKPKPTAMKQLAGNPGKRKLNSSEPAFPAADAEHCPPGMPVAGRRFWKQYYPLLQSAGVLKASDLAAFEALCRAWAFYLEADKQCRKGGLIQTSDKGYEAPSGWVMVRSKFFSELKSLVTVFGLSPSDRARIKAEPAEERDAFAEAFGVSGGPAVVGRIGA